MFGKDAKGPGFLSRIGARELIGLDFNDNSLKIARIITSPRKKEVADVVNRNIDGLADEDVARLIKTSFSELKIKNPSIINVIPTHLIITKNIEIPSTDPAEIKEIINLQASRHTPYSREEIIVDYIPIGSYKHSYTKVLLVIVTRNIVKRNFDVLHKAGFRLDRVLLAAEGLALSAGRILKQKTSDLPVNVVHIGAGFTDFVIVFKNKAVFIRSIPIGAQHIMQEEKHRIRFVEELRGSLEAYQSENIEKPPASLVLTGAVESLKGLDTSIGNTLRLKTDIVPYFKNLPISTRALRAASDTRLASFLGTLAPVFTSEEAKVDLIPEEIKLRRSLEERGKELIKMGAFTLTIFVLSFSILVARFFLKTCI